MKPIALFLCVVAGLLANAPGRAEEPAATPREWAFCGEFSGAPTFVCRLETGDIPKRVGELLPKLVPQDQQPIAQLIAQVCPKACSLAIWPDEREPTFLAVADVGTMGAMVLTTLDGFVTSLFGVAVKTDPATGRRDLEAAEFSFLIRDSRLLVGTPKRLDAALAAPKAAPDAVFAWLAPLLPALAVEAPPGSLTLRWAFDATLLPPRELAHFRRGPAEVLRVLGLDSIELRAAGCLTLDPKGLTVAAAAPRTGPPEGLLKVLFPEPGPVYFAERFPADTLDFRHLPLGSLDGLLDTLDGIEARWGGEVVKEYREELAELDRELGFSFAKDLLAQFPSGGSVGLLKPAIPLDQAPLLANVSRLADSWVAVLPCQDGPKAEALLTKWLGYAGKAAVRHETGGVPIQDLHEKGGLRCAYAFKDGLLYVGGSLDAVTRTLAVRPGAGTLAESPTLVAWTKNGARAGAFERVDLSGLAGLLGDWAKRDAAIPAPVQGFLTALARDGGNLLGECARGSGLVSLKVTWQDADLFALAGAALRLARGEAPQP